MRDATNRQRESREAPWLGRLPRPAGMPAAAISGATGAHRTVQQRRAGARSLADCNRLLASRWLTLARCTELVHRGVVERDMHRTGILLEVRDLARTRNRQHHLRPREQPRDRDLCRRATEPLGGRFE